LSSSPLRRKVRCSWNLMMISEDVILSNSALML
jgi:hypothetical protein